MSVKLYRFFDRIGTWPAAALLVAVFLLCTQGFSGRQAALGYDNRILDARQWYTPADAQSLFQHLGEGGRRLYALTEVTLDLIFPLIYGTLFALLIARLYGPSRGGLLWIPLLATVFDLLENANIAFLALAYAGQPSAQAWVALACTLVKSVLFVGSLLLIVVGGILGLRKGTPLPP